LNLGAAKLLIDETRGKKPSKAALHAASFMKGSETDLYGGPTGIAFGKAIFENLIGRNENAMKSGINMYLKSETGKGAFREVPFRRFDPTKTESKAAMAALLKLNEPGNEIGTNVLKALGIFDESGEIPVDEEGNPIHPYMLNIANLNQAKDWKFDGLRGFQSKNEIVAAYQAAADKMGKGNFSRTLSGLKPYKSQGGKMFLDFMLGENQQEAFAKLLTRVVPDMIDPDTGRPVTKDDVEERLQEFLKDPYAPVEIKSGKIDTGMATTQFATRPGFKGIMLGDTSEPGAVEEAWKAGWVLVHYKPTSEMLKKLSMEDVMAMKAGIDPATIAKVYGGDINSLSDLEKTVKKLDDIAEEMNRGIHGKGFKPVDVDGSGDEENSDEADEDDAEK